MKRKDIIDDIILMSGICLLFVFLLFFAPAEAADYGPYHVQVVEVIDGDTIRVDVELWPGLTQRVSIRLKGVNTAELRTRLACEKEAAKNAKAFVQGQVMRASEIIITDIQHDKYAGRALGRVWLDGNDLASMLIATGHGRPYDGGQRGAWCEE